MKRRVLFVLLADRSKASSRVRGFWVAEALRAQGYDVTVYAQAVDQPGRLWLASFYLGCLRLLRKHEVLVLQKRNMRWDYYLLRLAQMFGLKAIYDTDDYYSPTSNPTTLNNVARLMRNADAVTVGSEALREWALRYQPNCYLHPTSVRVEHYGTPAQSRQGSELCLGWIGNGRIYAPDLVTILSPCLPVAARTTKVRLKLVGACNVDQLHALFKEDERIETTVIDSIDWKNPEEIQKSMEDFDVGIYPLRDNAVNRHKCGFKALEYMAQGIPVIASPIGANAYVVDDGVTGFHAETTEDWVRAIERLAFDPELRRTMGQAGRAKVEAEYTTTAHARALAILIRSL